MNLSDIATTLSCTPDQAELAHRVATTRLGRELLLPLSLEGSQAVAGCLMTLPLATISHSPDLVAEAAGLAPEDLEVLRSLKPDFFNQCITLDGRVGQFIAA